jgi:hypothetical protein
MARIVEEVVDLCPRIPAHLGPVSAWRGWCFELFGRWDGVFDDLAFEVDSQHRYWELWCGTWGDMWLEGLIKRGFPRSYKI